MYVFHGNLEAIETTGFCDLYFLTEPLHLEEIHERLQRCLLTKLQVRGIDAVSNSSSSACGIIPRWIPDVQIITATWRAVASHSFRSTELYNALGGKGHLEFI